MRTTLARKDFIRQSAGALAALCLAPYGALQKPPVRNLSFSTLACPQWDLKTIISFAAANGYKGVELRVVAGELDLPGLPEFSAGKIAATKRMIADKGIRIVDTCAYFRRNCCLATKRRLRWIPSRKTCSTWVISYRTAV